jgi:hypothetical protein
LLAFGVIITMGDVEEGVPGTGVPEAVPEPTIVLWVPRQPLTMMIETMRMISDMANARFIV